MNKLNTITRQTIQTLQIALETLQQTLTLEQERNARLEAQIKSLLKQVNIDTPLETKDNLSMLCISESPLVKQIGFTTDTYEEQVNFHLEPPYEFTRFSSHIGFSELNLTANDLHKLADCITWVLSRIESKNQVNTSEPLEDS